MSQGKQIESNSLQSVTLEQALQSLGPMSKQIAVFAFQNPKLNQTEIGKQFGVSAGRVHQVLNANRVLRAFNALARHKLKHLVPKAVDNLDRLLNQENDVSRKVAEKILENEKVLAPAELKITNQLEKMSYQDLKKFISSVESLPEPSIEADIVDDSANA